MLNGPRIITRMARRKNTLKAGVIVRSNVTCLLTWTSQERKHRARQYFEHFASIPIDSSPNPKPKKRRKRPVARGSRPTVTTLEGGAEKRYQEDPNA